MQTKYIFLALLLLFCSCNYFKPPEYPEYDIPKTPNNSDKLRLDGYYYYLHDDSVHINTNFLYRDGVVLFLGSCPNFSIFEEQVFYNFYHGDITHWGIYLIKNDSIVSNLIYMDIDRRYKSKITKGVILNDTTIKLEYTQQSNGERNERKEILHFKQYSPKPDSTNIFTDR